MFKPSSLNTCRSFTEGFERILAIEIPTKEEKTTVGKLVNRFAQDFLKRQNEIMKGNIPMEPVGLVISYICSRSGHFASLDDKVRQLLKEKNLEDLLKEDELDSFLKNIYKQQSKMYQDAKEKIQGFLKAVEDLRDSLKLLTESERLSKFETEFEKILREKAKIGRKGRDNILRDYGFFKKHIPIDAHEQRFILRTGIFHKYATLENSDPTNYDDLANALCRFCKEELKKLKVEGIPLSDAPGLVDLIIWYFSQEKTEKKISLKICAKKPRCKKCPLTDLCVFARMNELKIIR